MAACFLPTCHLANMQSITMASPTSTVCSLGLSCLGLVSSRERSDMCYTQCLRSVFVLSFLSQRSGYGDAPDVWTAFQIRHPRPTAFALMQGRALLIRVDHHYIGVPAQTEESSDSAMRRLYGVYCRYSVCFTACHVLVALCALARPSSRNTNKPFSHCPKPLHFWQ